MPTLPIVHQKSRRSSRLIQAIPLTVRGSDTSRTPFLEHVSTVTVSCHGCRYRSKNKVMPGDLVLLAVEGLDLRVVTQSRARVKRVSHLGRDANPFDVILELETPGNIWGISSPPQDWSIREAAAGKVAASDPRVLARNEAQGAKPALASAAAPSERTAPGSPSPFVAQFMLGLNEQIRIIASDAATAAIAEEKKRILEGFRKQLHDESKKVLEQAILVARESAGSTVLQELNVAHEAAARSTYEQWGKKLEHDFGEIAQRSVSLGSKVSERVEKAALGTAERVQQTLDVSRREAVDQFRARIRTEIAPALNEAQSALQKLAAFQDEAEVRSLEICEQFCDLLKDETQKSSTEIQQTISECDQQIATALDAWLSKASKELETKSAELTKASAENVRKLSRQCEQGVQSRLMSLAESSADFAANVLKEKIAALSSQFSSEMESYRKYLQLISASIGEIANRPAARTQH